MTDKIREARDQAAQAAARAAEASDPHTKAIYRQIAAGWTHIEGDLEFVALLETKKTS